MTNYVVRKPFCGYCDNEMTEICWLPGYKPTVDELRQVAAAEFPDFSLGDIGVLKEEVWVYPDGAVLGEDDDCDADAPVVVRDQSTLRPAIRIITELASHCNQMREFIDDERGKTRARLSDDEDGMTEEESAGEHYRAIFEEEWTHCPAHQVNEKLLVYCGDSWNDFTVAILAEDAAAEFPSLREDQVALSIDDDGNFVLAEKH